jgi:hypothetical protein
VRVASIRSDAAHSQTLQSAADDDGCGAASPLSATAHVDVQITIPKFIFLRVGTGTGTAAGGWGTNGTINLIT